MNRYISSLMALCLAFALVLPVEAKEAESFRDVPTNYWAYSQINEMVNQGIVGGYKDGTFKPEAPVSYGAFSLMLARVFYPNELADGSIAVGDAIMEQHGISKDSERQRTATVGQAMSREDMSLYMYNILQDLGIPVPNSNEYNQSKANIIDFFDISPFNRQAVLVCYTLGLLGGRSDGTFGPKANMTRAQAAVVLSRLQKYISENGGTATPSTPSTPSTPTTPTTPTTPAPEVTELPAFKLQDGENVEQMMSRINAATPAYRAGYLSNGKPITEENIKEMLEQMKEDMPEGTRWDEDGIFHYSSPKFGGGGGCNAFEYACSDYIFGEDAPMTKHQNFDQLKVGDVVYVKNSENGYSHVIVITSMTNPRGAGCYSYCSGNSSGQVSWEGWGRFATLNEPVIANSGSYVYSRY